MTCLTVATSVVLAVGFVSYGFVDAAAFDGVTLLSIPTLLGATIGIGGLLRYTVRGGGVGGVWAAVFAVPFALSVHGQQLLVVSLGVGDVPTATAVARAAGFAGSLAAVVGSVIFAVGTAIRRRDDSVSHGDVTPLSFLLDVRTDGAAMNHDRVTAALAVAGVASLVVAGSLLPWSTAIYTVGIAVLVAVALYARIRGSEPSAQVGSIALVAVLLAAYLSQVAHPALLNGVVVVVALGAVGYGSARGESALTCLSFAVHVSFLLGVVWGVQVADPSLFGVLSAGVESGLGLGLVVGVAGYSLGWALRPDGKSETERRAWGRDVSVHGRRGVRSDD
ncbi:hypothetical protein [Haloprofundus halobius]|uniref:hypothetical protein n=1 Tax=Haloprofundus halobius TaxID=2876194 RepID=UPI001CCDF684|nr:hypothetical protein [Haloprofundus halobius]